MSGCLKDVTGDKGLNEREKLCVTRIQAVKTAQFILKLIEMVEMGISTLLFYQK